MASELSIVYEGSRPVYAVIRDSDGKVWNGVGYETWNIANIGNYAVSLSSQGGALYVADSPVGLTRKQYTVVCYEQSGSQPSDDDTILTTGYSTFGTVLDISTPAAGDGNYLLIDEVRAFKVAGETVSEVTGYSDSEIGTEIALMESIVEAITNDIFYSKAETVLFDGSGTVKLFFQPQVVYPLISVTSVRNYDVDGSTLLDDYTDGDDFLKYPYYLEMVRDFPGDSPRRRFGSGGVWPRGQQNIQVVGVWGRSNVPAAIKRATLLLTLERLAPGCTGVSPKDVSASNWSDFSISFQAANATGQSTGFAEVDRLLELHINFVTLFQAVPDKKQTYDN